MVAIAKLLLFLVVLIAVWIYSVQCMDGLSISDSKSQLSNARVTLFNAQTANEGSSISLTCNDASLNTVFATIIPNCVNYVTVHGFATGSENIWAYELKNKILASHCANVFIVDWSSVDETTDETYELEYAKAREVAELLANLFNSWNFRNTNFENTIFIGHSIGARIADSAIEQMHASVDHLIALDPNKKVRQIPGLNASKRAMHTAFNSFSKLKAAKFTTVIHTDAVKLGLLYNVGSSDVYLNGGEMQPGCQDAHSDFLYKTNCNHNFAAKFFKSISVHAIKGSRDNNQTADDEINKCFSIAYMCESFESFIEGRCGLCENRFPGHNQPVVNTCFHPGLPPPSENHNQLAKYRMQRSIFTLLTDENGDCVYTYRILVGIQRKRKLKVSRDLINENRVFVRILLSDQPHHWRTVELAPILEFEQLEANEDLERQILLSRSAAKTSAKRLDERVLNSSNSDYRSGIVTFKSKQCIEIETNNCLDEPLTTPPLLDVWGKNIEKVQFIAFDYMSHLNFDIRKKHSLLLTRAHLFKEHKSIPLPHFDYFASFSERDNRFEM